MCFTGYKLVHAVTPNGLVPAIAEVCIDQNNKVIEFEKQCRTSSLFVKDIYDFKNAKIKYYIAYSAYCSIEVKYKVGQISKADKLDERENMVCVHGLHFFKTISDLKDYVKDYGYGRDFEYWDY